MPAVENIRRREVGGNIWLSHDAAEPEYLAQLPVKDLEYEVMPSEEAVGRAMLDEIKSALAAKEGSVVMILVGGRGGQALHRLRQTSTTSCSVVCTSSRKMPSRLCDWTMV
jgi:hypothetical protein